MTKTPSPADPEDNLPAALPPHLAILAPMQRAFVQHFILLGGQEKAAAAAGYGGADGKYCAQRGHELMKLQKIKDAITIEQMEHGHSLRSMALKVWREALNSPNEKIRLAAAKEIGDRFGLMKSIKAEHQHNHTHQFEKMTPDELKDFIRDKARASKIIDITPAAVIEDAMQAIDIPPLKQLLKPTPAEKLVTLEAETDADEAELLALLR